MRSTTRSRFVAGTAAAFAGISVAASPSRAATFRYKLGHNTTEGHPHSVRTKQMAAEVARATRGELVIDVFGNSVLGTDAAMLTQVRSGALQMELTAGTYLSSLARTAEMDAIPFAYPTDDVALRAFHGDLGRLIRDDVQSNAGLVPLNPWDTGFRHVTSGTKPIARPDDFSGFKIRTPPSRLWIDCFKSLGAAPSPLAFSEVYVSLQTHLIDGQESPLDFIEFFRFFEVQRYLSLTRHMWGSRWLVINADAWKALPKEHQNVLAAVSANYARLAHQDLQQLNTALVDKLRRHGLTVNSVDQEAFRRKLGPAFYERWREHFGPVAWSLLEKYTGRLT